MRGHENEPVGSGSIDAEAEVEKIINTTKPEDIIWPIEIEIDSWPGGRIIETFEKDGSWSSETLLG